MNKKHKQLGEILQLPDDAILSQTEFARFKGVHPGAVTNWLKRGQLQKPLTKKSVVHTRNQGGKK